ncbi:response regulator transcription factor [Edaphobacter aggregans]|uniref:response regulator transcription factor n=1 Tax=Edaphobacter aggregans TaxID=570835 RepID=UPI00068D7140|nr:response regulator transcription factor [Edaphobacter aggregans]
MDISKTSAFRPRILIADDHAIFAEAMSVYLERTFNVVGVVANGRTMLEEAIKLRPDVVVTDIAMPLLNGLDAARRVKERVSNVKFVFLTMLDDANLAAAALEIGPVAFVLKRSGGRELLRAIEEILHGRPYITPELKSEDWVAAKARARQFSKDLTKRQRDVVQLFAEGRSIKEIAGILNLSEKTVEFHKHHIMEAFHIKTNADLVLFGLKRGLIAIHPESPSVLTTEQRSSYRFVA